MPKHGGDCSGAPLSGAVRDAMGSRVPCSHLSWASSVRSLRMTAAPWSAELASCEVDVRVVFYEPRADDTASSLLDGREHATADLSPQAVDDIAEACGSLGAAPSHVRVAK